MKATMGMDPFCVGMKWQKKGKREKNEENASKKHETRNVCAEM